MKRLPFPLAAVLAACLLALPGASALARHEHPEKHYQKLWCDRQGGVLEVVMPSGSRCDCLTDSHAVEFDFAPKWAESVGQALNYAAQTGRKAGVVLIVEKPGDRRFVRQILIVKKYNGLELDVWLVDADGNDLGEAR
jgi:hypothetical protein